ncbi:MAG: tRNA 2-thiouridine(34) synthase MnmA [Deltaproteobacteria bacterium]|nr:tRNA 2-thiouridine(34) synthase MnmA [Deltaproteobacteria bacterium]MBW2141741.1 tRNA 2-thiouridine(34) synthase MnmA [Deltaproteobacteria bacterium]MBW2323780.1 tRNA 2-thiouridine(34) synthase MnmA [Deltaproteobacteria bacterium]
MNSRFKWKPFKPKPGSCVAVAMSGGVDSTIAARRLIEQGHEVIAFHLALTTNPPALDQAQTASRLIGLNLEVLDLSLEFEKLIVNPFVRSYVLGETPSPCVACNPVIKFNLLWEEAKLKGADYLATGHYAQLVTIEESATPIMSRPFDRNKDQTYFLCRLSPETLSRAVFPLANTAKEEVKEEALSLGLTPRMESQDACFLFGKNYRDFLLARLAQSDITPGDFVDTEGRVLGRHRGLVHYTIGQRRSLGIPGPEPYYVLSLDSKNNRVVLGTKQHIFSKVALVRDLVWSFAPSETQFTAKVQIRSRHRPALAEVNLLLGNRAKVIFHEPQSAITPGQAAVFYDEDILLGGGWIEKPSKVSIYFS